MAGRFASNMTAFGVTPARSVSVSDAGGPLAAVSGTTGSPSVDTASRTGKTIYTFNGDGTITFSAPGFIEIRLCGGGGGGGSLGTFAGGSGGAGGHVYVATFFVRAATYTVTIGAGGAIDGNGNPSYFTNGSSGLREGLVAYEGGGGSPANQNGKAGASGGGGGNGASSGGAATYTGSQGNAGAVSGAGGAGGAAVGNTSGAGLANSITGTSVTKCAGGDGASTPGAANSGNGGGSGRGGGGAGTAGGSGQCVIVIG